jgi:hypothetical protein
MKRIIIIGIIVAIFAACGSGVSSLDKSISQVEKALEKVEKNKGKMTEIDWQSLEKEVEEPLQAIANALENNKIGMADRIKVMALMGKWATVVMEAGFSEMERQTGINRDEWGKELEKASEEIQKAIQGIDTKELEKATEELQKALQGIGTN